MKKGQETSKERNRKKDNTYSKSAGILNIKELNSMLKFPKYLFINITPCFLRNTDVHSITKKQKVYKQKYYNAWFQTILK